MGEASFTMQMIRTADPLGGDPRIAHVVTGVPGGIRNAGLMRPAGAVGCGHEGGWR